MGYLLLEIPGSLIAAKYSASKWIARIMFTWGLVCVLMAFMSTQTEFYIYRFLLGASEASLYPVIYSVLFPRWFTPKERARATSLMLTSLLLSTIIGAPLAGVLLNTSILGMGMMMIGLFAFSFLDKDTSFYLIGINLAFIGLGFGLFASPNNNALWEL